MYYTIGQRKGLNIGGATAPWFVCGKNYDQNILYIAQGDESEWLHSDGCLVSDMNWIIDDHGDEFHCQAKFRYRQKDNEVTIKKIDDTHIFVTFETPIKSVTPGQACVLYFGEECLGGGIIKEVRKNNEKLWYL